MTRERPDNKSSREELQRILDFSPDIICTIGPDGKFVRVSAAVRNILGYSPDEMEGRSVFDFVVKDDRAKTAAIGEKLLTEKEISHFENRYMHKAGHTVLIIWTCYWDTDQQQLYSVGRDGTERQKTELQLLASEQRFRTLIENSVDSVAILSPDGWPTYVSPSITNILGYTEEEALSMNLGALMHPDDMEQVSSTILQSLQQPGVPQSPAVARARHKDGSWRWMEATITNMLDDPIINGIVDNFRDVTDTIMAEAHRKQSEGFLKEAQRLAKMGSWNFDFEHDKLSWSDSLYDVFGVDRETFLETHGSFLSLIHPEDKKLAEQTSKRTQETGETFNIEYRITTPAGERRVIEEFGYGEKNASGKVVRLFGTAQDISERRKAEEQIRLANERFEKVAQATSDIIWDWDIVNDRLYRGSGFKTDEQKKDLPTISEWSENIHPDDKEGITQSVQNALENRDTSVWQHEYRFRKKDDEYAHVIDRGMVIRDHSGKAVRMVGAITDISYRKEYEESLTRLNAQLERHAKDLELSNKELEQFAYIASHDLQEPLRMVSSFMTQLDKKYADRLDDKARQYIHFAVDGAMRMKQIILDLLEFSRVGKHEGKLKDVSLNEVLKEVLHMQQKKIEESGASIQFEQLPTLRTYRSPLVQVMHNLLGNALKYHREGMPPEIYIEAREHGNKWLISVKDNGIGIESEYHDKIFIIFQRLHGKDEFSGTGIGLAIVKKIVENLGGSIWLESEPGYGSTFYFTLPRENDSPPSKGIV